MPAFSPQFPRSLRKLSLRETAVARYRSRLPPQLPQQSLNMQMMMRTPTHRTHPPEWTWSPNHHPTRPGSQVKGALACLTVMMKAWTKSTKMTLVKVSVLWWADLMILGRAVRAAIAGARELRSAGERRLAASGCRPCARISHLCAQRQHRCQCSCRAPVGSPPCGKTTESLCTRKGCLRMCSGMFGKNSLRRARLRMDAAGLTLSKMAGLTMPSDQSCDEYGPTKSKVARCLCTVHSFAICSSGAGSLVQSQAPHGSSGAGRALPW